ncbi:ArnT family glycosyltransferase [Acinetobacter brisouii]|uniref:ArnT family glycosyltransferase n=1 Tax=Acinetobacter brisouii TaxID=396323 RepID=UPI00124FA293|nr:glycosyltransferase family 39 protein [Acinetobacter brisouii]
MQPLNRSSKLLLILLPIWLFITAIIRPMSVPDEGRYGDISRAMFETGDWLTPRINGFPFMHKPPLLHWISTGLMEIFGVHLWVLRLVPVLAATLMLTSIFFFVRKYINEQVAQLSVFILATSLLFFGSSQYINHDLLVAAWMTLTVFCFADYTLSGKKSILFLGYVACAGGFLSKGLIGVLVPGMVILPWVIYCKEWKKIPALLNPFGILLFILLAGPWLYLAQQHYPNFLHYFFIEQQFDRFSSSGFNNKQPWFFYIVILFFSFLPWLMLTGFKGIKQHIRTAIPSPILALLLWWLVSVLVFFSIPPSKLAGYILPAIAPLTILITAWVQQALIQHKNKLQQLGSFIFITLIGIAILVAPHVIKENHGFYLEHIGFISILGAILIISPWMLFTANKAGKLSLFQATACSLVILCSVIPFAVRMFDTKTNHDQTQFQQYLHGNTQLVFYHYYFYDLPFLLDLKTPVYLVNNWDNVGGDNSSVEIKDGLLFEPQLKRYLWNDAALEQALNNKQPLIVISRPHDFKPADPHVKVLHQRNYDVFIFNQ